MSERYTVQWTDGDKIMSAYALDSASAGQIAVAISREVGTVGFVLVRPDEPILGTTEFRYEWGRLVAYVQYGITYVVDDNATARVAS